MHQLPNLIQPPEERGTERQLFVHRDPLAESSTQPSSKLLVLQQCSEYFAAHSSVPCCKNGGSPKGPPKPKTPRAGL